MGDNCNLEDTAEKGLRIIILLGPPGSGKGTLAQKCKQHGFLVIGAGDLLRERALLDDALSKKLRAILDRGHMVDNTLILEIVSSQLEQYKNSPGVNGILLDGYPRNATQMEEFFQYLKTCNPDFLGNIFVFFINAEDQLMRTRINNRFICTNEKCLKVNPNVTKCNFCGAAVTRRNDDLSNEVISTRLEVFKQSVKPLLDFFGKQNIKVCNFALDEHTNSQDTFIAFKNFLAIKEAC